YSSLIFVCVPFSSFLKPLCGKCESGVGIHLDISSMTNYEALECLRYKLEMASSHHIHTLPYDNSWRAFHI
ncbi:Hypothetical protein FKW44_011676, partial [Caligus rogercresseyi]